MPGPMMTAMGPLGFQGIQIVRPAPSQRRVFRKPRHVSFTRQAPWEIQPFMIAPVLPGETMENLLVQANVRSDALNGDALQTGWWHELFFFYVKHTDLEATFYPNAPGSITAMHLSTTFDPAPLAALNPDADETTYHNGEGIDWSYLCLRACTEWYFRNEGEEWLDYVGPSGLPLASINAKHWSDTMAPALGVAEGGEDEELPGEVDDFSNLNVPAGFEEAFTMYQQMIASGLTEATFEDYLKSFGIRPARELKETLHKPELLRYLRDWQYPRMGASVSGVGAAAIAEWKHIERADKTRFFQEPGFIFGVTVVRPKTFFGNQQAPLVNIMADPYSWLPAVLRDEAYTSLRKIDNLTGPFKDLFAEDYWVDIKDLFLYGDQFTNITPGSVPGNVPLPDADYIRRYVNGAVVPIDPGDSVFGAMFAEPASYFTQMDAIVTLNIRGRITETTPGPGAPSVAVAP